MLSISSLARAIVDGKEIEWQSVTANDKTKWYPWNKHGSSMNMDHYRYRLKPPAEKPAPERFAVLDRSTGEVVANFKQEALAFEFVFKMGSSTYRVARYAEVK
jgi:hypothetical protein